MKLFLLGLLVGVWTGAPAGMFIAAVLHAAAASDRDIERKEREK